MENLSQSLVNMVYLSGSISEKVDYIYNTALISMAYKKRGVNALEDSCSDACRKMAVLECYSFLNEYNDFFGVKTEVIYKDRIKNVKQVCKPFVSQLKKWNLAFYRNTIIAHNLRDKKYKSILFDDNVNSLNVPKTALDYVMLRDCINTIVHIAVMQEFGIEYIEGIKNFNKFHKHPSNDTTIIPGNFYKIYDELIEESNTQSNILNLKYNYNVNRKVSMMKFYSKEEAIAVSKLIEKTVLYSENGNEFFEVN